MSKIFFFIVSCLLIFSIYFFLFLNNKNVYKNENFINISKGSDIDNIVDIILHDENYFNKKIYSVILKFYNNFYKTIKFGEFKINKDLNLIEITNIITNPSNVYREFQIIGGWEFYQLEGLINKKFNNSYPIYYSEVLADTYKYQSHNNMEDIYKLMKKSKDIFFSKYKNNQLLRKYSINEIMIIGSLIEKEAKSDQDKRLVSSVILNRLDNNIKLQVDATTIFSITKGEYKLKRKLNYQDLKNKDEYNTYYISGLPPLPICYVSRKTIEILLENYKSEYLFYFFNEKVQKHIFSKTYKQHKKLLEEYRKNE